MYWRAAPVQGPMVVVQPLQTWVAGPRLFVRTTVINQGPAPIVVVRDAVALALPDGRMIGRSTGATTIHNSYVIPPGAAHAVYVDFREEGFEWAQIPSAQVLWHNAISVAGGGPLPVPPMTIMR